METIKKIAIISIIFKKRNLFDKYNPVWMIHPYLENNQPDIEWVLEKD